MPDSTDSGGGAGVAFLVLIVLGLYFLPTIVALARHVPDRGTVIVVNTMLGWTLLGWVFSMAMAARSRQQPVYVLAASPALAAQPVAAPAAPPAGWYRDPTDAGLERWWDGGGWTETRRWLP